MPLYINPQHLLVNQVMAARQQAAEAAPQAPDGGLARKFSTLAGATGSGLDWLSTYDILKRGGHETNPLLQWTNDNPLGTALAGAGMDVATGLLVNQLLKNHPKIRNSIFIGRGALGAGAAAHNFNTPGSIDPKGGP